MNAPELQVQFDPSSARFGASRSQKRLEDDRLLVGKGLYSDDRELTGYLSAEWLRQVCSSPGSPFALVDRAEREADEAHVRALTARAEADRALVEALRERIADLEARLEAVPPPIDAAALAAELAPALAPALDERFARKPGPRRKAA